MRRLAATKLLTKRELDRFLERVWGAAYVHDIHYLKVFIRRLRQKLGDAAEHPRYIRTEWGIGYRFVGRR